ncbi:SpoIIIAH-like family protein [Effusibacillus consociatus]|uniref:SpoIIIAH-like family protein n=1 Tax=Effusibacillus consociatus TaxID=1117041 RepID=A0ABV9Q5S7_9BACL
MAKRQTVWLSTMMILSLMVIGYYTVDDTLTPVPANTTDGKKTEQPSKDSGKEQGKTTENKETMTGGDWFVEEALKREDDYSRKMEELQHVLADSKTTTEQKVKAEQELNALKEFNEKASNAEGKVVAEGFEEALITKGNDNRITVTVQAAQLSKEQAAKIYMIVSKELNVPAHQIVVSYKQ